MKMADDCGCTGGPRKLNVVFAAPESPSEPTIPYLDRIIEGWLDTPAGRVPRVRHDLDTADRLGAFGARWGFNRMDYTVRPGLYAFGNPDAGSPVLVTCNYKLTFDRLRRDWKGLNAWVLALDTKGVNVWCAAGKGTFGTEELVTRIGLTGLAKVVSHREIILPQLGAPGVAGFEVKKHTGFKVIYGPVRAQELLKFLADGKKATPAMRQVEFPIGDRFVLTPIEIVGAKNHLLIVLVFGLAISGFGPGGFSPADALLRGLIFFGAAFVGLVCGGILTPILLPWVPGRMFAVKGAIIGVLGGGALALALVGTLREPELAAVLFAACAVSSFSAMNFTGASTFTSQSGVMAEMKRCVPMQVGAAVAAIALWLAGPFV